MPYPGGKHGPGHYVPNVGDGDFSFENSTAADNIFAGISIAQTKSVFPFVVTQLGDWFLEAGTGTSQQSGFTRLQFEQNTWGVPIGDEKTQLIQNSGDGLNIFSAVLGSLVTFNPSGRKWWFSFGVGTTGIKTGNFTLEVWNNAVTVLHFTTTLNITLIAIP